MAVHRGNSDIELRNMAEGAEKEKRRMEREIESLQSIVDEMRERSREWQEWQTAREVAEERANSHILRLQQLLAAARHDIGRLEAEAREHDRERQNWTEHQDFILQQIIESQSVFAPSLPRDTEDTA